MNLLMLLILLMIKESYVLSFLIVKPTGATSIKTLKPKTFYSRLTPLLFDWFHTDYPFSGRILFKADSVSKVKMLFLSIVIF